MSDAITATHAYPHYGENISYAVVGGYLRPWEYSGWKPESLSWKQSCYIHTGLSGLLTTIAGPDADAFVSWLCTNSLKNFPEGTMRHALMCNDDGLLAAHGILQRDSSGRYSFFAAPPWPQIKAAGGKFNVQLDMTPIYLTQIAGPLSLEALQRASGEGLSDIGFLRYRNTTIAGKNGRSRADRHVRQPCL